MGSWPIGGRAPRREVTECDDDDAHRSRIAGRQWAIRDWYELDWEHVQRARNEWEPIVDADLVLSGLPHRQRRDL